MRIWKTSDSDLELDKIKEEIMSQLASISDKEAFKLVADIIKDLEAHPNLTTINTFLERFNCLKGDIALSLTDINRHLLKLKSFFSSFSSSHVYSSEDIASSHSFAGFSATHSPLINETVSSQGSYRIQPTSKEIANGLKTYERSNRPSVQFIDETGEDSILCFERSDQETISPSQAEFSQQIFKFCNKDLSATYFLCANLGIEALSFIACENINTLNAAESYISIFSADYYTLRWRKLKDPEGNTYYLHELYSAQHGLKTTSGSIHCLDESSCTDLKTLSEIDYENQLKAGKLIALLSVAATVELRIVESTPQIKVTQYSVNIATSSIKPKEPAPTLEAPISASVTSTTEESDDEIESRTLGIHGP